MTDKQLLKNIIDGQKEMRQEFTEMRRELTTTRQDINTLTDQQAKFNDTQTKIAETLVKVLDDVGSLQSEVALNRKEIYDLRHDMNDGFKKTHQRIDKIGIHLAEVDDDAPSSQDFRDLEERVSKLEEQIATV